MQLFYSKTLMPRTACAVARYTEAPVELVLVDLPRGEQHSSEFRHLNPNGKVPVLVHENGSIWETDAIVCYLARRYRPALWPEDLSHETVRWMSWNARYFSNAGSILYFEHVIKRDYLKKEPDPRAVENALRDFRKFADILDSHLSDKDFLLGSSITVADFLVATVLPYAGASKLPISEFNSISNWNSRLEELPAWQDPY